jgi:uncharacterized membrane protein (DUF485 family)
MSHNADRDVQPLDRLGVLLSLVLVVLAALFELAMYNAPEFLSRPLWEGSALTVALLLGFLSFLIPVVTAWLICRNDTPDEKLGD